MAVTDETTTPAAARAKRTVTYVVQVRRVEKIGDVSGVVVWADAGEITVPSRTKMATVRDRAAELLFESGEAHGEGPWTVRVLDPDAAKAFRVRAKQRDPELVVEEVD